MGNLKNQLMSISEMDELIGIATRAEVTDDYGAIRITDSTPTVNIRAKVRYERTNEGEGAKQEKFTQEIKVHIRFNSLSIVTNLIYWESKYYDIYAVETTPKQRFHVLKARLIEQ